MRRAGHRPFRSRRSRNTGRPACARSGGRPVHPRVRHWRGCRIRLAVHPQPREGEKAVREAFPATTLIRPCIMFGRGDAFLIPIARMLRRLPVFPLFGRGQTQLQPACVEDVADAIASGSNQIFESWLGFPMRARRASLRDARRKIPLRLVRYSPAQSCGARPEHAAEARLASCNRAVDRRGRRHE